jgi:hypothetical protein
MGGSRKPKLVKRLKPLRRKTLLYPWLDPEEKLVAKLEAIFLNDGYAVYFKMKRIIYSTKAVELRCVHPGMVRTYAKACNVTPETWQQIVTMCAKLKLFEPDKWRRERILTAPHLKDLRAKEDKERANKLFHVKNSMARKRLRESGISEQEIKVIVG